MIYSNIACTHFGVIVLYETCWFEHRTVLFGPLSLAGYDAGEILFEPSSLVGYNAGEMILGLKPSRLNAGDLIKV